MKTLNFGDLLSNKQCKIVVLSWKAKYKFDCLHFKEFYKNKTRKEFLQEVVLS